MSSQKDVKPNVSSSTTKQTTLFGFFSKPASSSGPGPASSSPSTSRAAPSKKAAPVQTPLARKGSGTGAGNAGGSSGGAGKAGKAKSAPAPAPAAVGTSEGEVLMLESSDVEAEAPMKAKVPAKRPVKEEEEDEDEGVRARRKRPSLARKPTVVDSEEESEEDVKPKKAPAKKAANGKGGKGKGKKKGDDDDFSASGTASEDSDDYFNDDLDEALAALSDGSVASGSGASSSGSAPAKKKPAAKPKKPLSTSSSLAGFKAGAKPSGSGAASPLARPQLKSSGSGSGGIGGIKTAAERGREKAKQDKRDNEDVFSFLLDPKDADGIRPGEPGYDPRTLYIPSSAWKTFTPFERQFWEIKQNHYDTVLFFQKGKFFELYEEDAAIGHREFDLKLTDRVKMKMVGVPESSFDFWAAKFLAQGYKVGRVDQCETALGAEIRNKDDKAAGNKGKGKKQANGKEIVRRELKSVLTSGTIVEGEMLTDDMSNHCVAIKEDTPTPSSPPSFGICVLDASTAEFQLSHFTDDACRTELETLIRQLKPKEIIHQKNNLSVATLRLLRSCLGVDCQWTALKEGKEFLRAEDAKDEVEKLFKAKAQEGAEEMEVDGEEGSAVPDSIRTMFDKPVAMSALGGMIWYLRQLNLDADLVTAKNFNIYDPLSRSSGTLALDGQTLAHIEVLQNSMGGTDGTLLQLLSRCVTPFGKRLFKVWLCAPLRDAEGINDRLDAVEDLLANANFAVTFDSMAKKLPDLERLLSRIHSKTITKKAFLSVIEAFEKINAGLGNLRELCEDFKSKGIPGLLAGTPDIGELLEEIQELYDGEELLPVDGKDEDYERVRENVEEVETALDGELKKAKKQLKCDDLVFKDVGTKDISQIEVPIKIKVPSNWTKISGTQKVGRYYTPETTRLIADLKEARERKQMVVNDFQFKLYGEFDKHYSTWMAVIKSVSQLDCLLSLSKSSAALGEPCVRPEIVESDTAIIEFEELRHPCILSASSDFIPNDVSLGGDAKNLMLLTGPNMAGKSTLLRMTCTAVIMAQLGCFVPAAKARIAPVDAIYSRMGANDAIFASASTFKVEMDDCNKILQKSTPRSLVILDELGRGTSTYDGMAIAYAVLHRLATHTGCVGFFATHFTSLTEDYAYHPQIRLANMQTSVNDETREVVFLYKLVDGSAPKSYGPHVASMAGLSETIVERAIGISKQFEETSRAKERAMRANETLPLTAQADAAFLLKLAQLSVAGEKVGGNKAQLLRTLDTMRRAVIAHQEQKAGAAVVAAAA
ncbi:DNA mismatch repair protein msh6 [Rhodosporidiobolus nylandii]